MSVSQQIKQHIKGKVRFEFARQGEMFYRTDEGLLFRVPMHDMGTGTFSAEDKAMLYMRWIRKELEGIAADRCEA